MITAQNLSKAYGKTTALQEVSLTIQAGELFGLIGPDGAGKTTLLRILGTLLLPDAGTAFLDGKPVVESYRAIRRAIGYMPGTFSLYQDLTVEENLHFFATIFGTSIAENYELIRDIYVQLEPFKNRRAGQLSGGMKQKLALCCALIHRPRILLLDEPTTGVDPVSREEFWAILQRLKSHGITMLVSTPYMDEASLCDRVALMRDGQVLSTGSPQSLIEAFDRPLLAVQADDTYRMLTDLRQFESTYSAFAFGHAVHLSLKTPVWPELVQSYLLNLKHTGVSVTPIAPSIEDVFIHAK